MCFDLFGVKSFSQIIAMLIRILNREDAVLRANPVIFSTTLKKKSMKTKKSRDVARILAPSFEGFTASSETRLVSWIPDNGKNLVPHRTIGWRYFQREDRFFVSHCLAHDAFRFRFYPFTFLLRFIFCSFSSVLLFFLLFHDFHHPVLWMRSVHRKVFFFIPQRNPSSSFILT